MKAGTKFKIEHSIKKLTEILNNDNGDGTQIEPLPLMDEELMIHVKLRIISRILLATTREQSQRILDEIDMDAEIAHAIEDLQVN